MKLMITAATEIEMEALQLQLKHKKFDTTAQIEISCLITGVGLVATTYAVLDAILQNKPDAILQIGIAGSFDHSLPLGTTVVVKDEILGDMGVEENGEWKDVFDMKFAEVSTFPFTNKRLENPFLQVFSIDHLDHVSAVSVNEVSTRHNRIEILKTKYGAAIESMEGAAFHYVCLQQKIPFLQIRGISNYVGERDKSEWRIKEALENLAEAAGRIIENLETV